MRTERKFTQPEPRPRLPWPKSDGYFDGQSIVTFKKEGFEDHTVLITSGADGWYIFGNLGFGFLIGWLIVDPATGAMWSSVQTDMDVDLASKCKP